MAGTLRDIWRMHYARDDDGRLLLTTFFRQHHDPEV
jgi:hypothetical protein